MNSVFLKNDIKNKKGITVILSLFIIISTVLMGSSTNILINIFKSMDNLFQVSLVPSVVQMHTGYMDIEKILNFGNSNEFVNKTQIAEMITINNDKLYLNSDISEYDSIMDISFVKQNKSFDFLLNLNNDIAVIKNGEIGIPVYYLKKNNINIGDKITLNLGNEIIEYKVAEIIRDAQMNTSIVHSKRFLISDEDYNYLSTKIDDREYLIEFLLFDNINISDFIDMYNLHQLPNNGAMVNYNLFLLLNSLTFGAIVLIIILISFFISFISIICIRFSIVSTLEEDFVDIGILKAIGLNNYSINNLFLTKYFVIIFSAAIVGFFISLVLSRFMLNFVQLYFGVYYNTLYDNFFTLVSVLIPSVLLFLYSLFLLQKFNKVMAIDAMNYNENLLQAKTKKINVKISNYENTDINILIALKNLVCRFKNYFTIFLVYTICVFIVIIPFNFSKTITSPSFINYMGNPNSDIRIDLTFSDSMESLNTVIAHINSDSDFVKKTLLVTNNLKYKTEEGKLKNLLVESGDLSAFQLNYVKGNPPKTDFEISLSELMSKELDTNINDSITVVIDEKEVEMTVSGMYQDITNGGRTAKTKYVPKSNHNTLWYIIYADYDKNVDVESKNKFYENKFKNLENVKVISITNYVNQTLGGLISSVKIISYLSILLASSIIILITYLYISMIFLKEKNDIFILSKLGVNMKNIQKQYIITFSIITYLGITIGLIFSQLLGSTIVSGIWSFLGASKVILVNDFIFNLIILPLFLLIIVNITIIASSRFDKNIFGSEKTYEKNY